MEKEQPRKNYLTSFVRFDNGFEITSAQPIRIGNWYIKASTSNYDTIIIVMTHISGDTEVGMFSDETDANKFVTFRIENDVV